MTIPAVSAAAGVTSRYQPLTPIRVVDTRTGLGGAALGVNGEFTVPVATAAVLDGTGIRPEDVTAVVVNLTAVDADGAGYFTAWPAGTTRPPTSSLNAMFAGHTIANLATIPVGSGGSIAVFSQSGADVLVDVQGVYVAAISSSYGRLVSATPRRVYDSREGPGVFGPGETRQVDVTVAGVPTDASAVVVNLTATGTLGPGFVTVWASGDWPTASNLNVMHADQTIANQVISALAGGQVAIRSSGGGHIVVDVVGYFTGGNAEPSADGLFVPVTPDRVVDTRLRASITLGLRPYAGAAFETAVAGTHGVPATDVAAVVLNATVTESVAAGFLTMWPARTPRPFTSVLNAERAGQTASNHVVAAVSPAGFSMFTQSGAHLVVDVTGYWTGPPLTATEGAPPPYQPLPAQPAQPPSHGAYALSEPLPNGGAGRWNPCAPIRYLVNDELATPAQRELLDAAIQDVTAATGIQFSYTGESSGGHSMSLPLVPFYYEAMIVFSNPSLSPGWLGFGKLGVTATFWTPQYDQIHFGVVLVDVNLGAGALMSNVLHHELGHLMGLEHVDDPHQVMFDGPAFASTYGPGDREGLWHVGAAHGCLPPVQRVGPP